MLLNRTAGRQARPVAAALLGRWPTPRLMSRADPAELEGVLRPLGFQRRRTLTLVGLSAAWLGLGGRRPSLEEVSALPGVGKYAADSYSMFVLGAVPDDLTDRQLLRRARETERRGRQERQEDREGGRGRRRRRAV